MSALFTHEATLTLDEIDALSIKQVREIVERASSALSQLRELGLLPGGVVPVRAASPAAASTSGHDPAPAADSPFPCASCGRVRPERPGESVKAEACDACGNRLPGGAMPSRVMNKPEQRRNGVVSAIVEPLSAEERARKMSLPAFTANGDPVDEDVS